MANLFEQLPVWEQREFLADITMKREVFKNEEEALNYFGYSTPKLSDYSAYEVVNEFWADDLLSEMSTDEISDYVVNHHWILGDVLDDADIDDILSHYEMGDVVEHYMNVVKKKDIDKFLNHIAETYNEEFMEWLHGTNYYRTEEEWKAFENSNNLDIKEENK